MKSLIIDAGNTRIKVATYFDGVLSSLIYFSSIDEISTIIDYSLYETALISSVLDEQSTTQLQNIIPKGILLDEKLKLPIQIQYDSISTLGKDRLANAVQIHELAPNQNALAIDLGTCIKFDFVDQQGVYKGGSISPGLEMRFKAMNHYTQKLPLIEQYDDKIQLIGNSSVNSMLSGVINGIQYEILGMIEAYKREFKDLIIFATGGDMKYLNLQEEFQIQNDENLTINGLYTLLKKQYEL